MRKFLLLEVLTMSSVCFGMSIQAGALSPMAAFFMAVACCGLGWE